MKSQAKKPALWSPHDTGSREATRVRGGTCGDPSPRLPTPHLPPACNPGPVISGRLTDTSNWLGHLSAGLPQGPKLSASAAENRKLAAEELSFLL